MDVKRTTIINEFTFITVLTLCRHIGMLERRKPRHGHKAIWRKGPPPAQRQHPNKTLQGQ